MAVPLPAIKRPFLDSNGDPLSGGKLYTYLAGTSTPLGTFTTEAGDVSNTNPIILNASGVADIFLGSGSYKFTLTDADDVVQWTVDNISSTANAAATSSGWTEHAITDGMAATDLSGETVDFATYSSAIYDCEILRGTTVIANGPIAIQNLNGTGRVKVGVFLAGEAHGVTFSVSQAALVAQLRAATSTGPGAGTIKLSRRLVPV